MDLLEWLALISGIGACVTGVWDVVAQTAAWDREQSAAFRRAVRKAELAGRLPPDWETWNDAQIVQALRELATATGHPEVADGVYAPVPDPPASSDLERLNNVIPGPWRP